MQMPPLLNSFVCWGVGGGDEDPQDTPPELREPMDEEEAGPRKRQRYRPMGVRQGPVAGQ